MNSSKFSITVLLLIVMIISAIGYLFTVKLVDIAYHPAVNDYYPIEDTGLGVRYSSMYPSGIYSGGRVAGELKLEGEFGYDWGAAAEGNWIYLNEYSSTSIGMTLCDLVRVDTETFEKEVLFKNAILRGRCASGELVCLSGFLMPANHPADNSLCRLYGMTSADIRPEEESAMVLFIDPKTGDVLYSVRDSEALTDAFEARYLQRTFKEVLG